MAFTITSGEFVYRGIRGVFEWDDGPEEYSGRLLTLAPRVTFRGDMIAHLEANFRDAVDSYLDGTR